MKYWSAKNWRVSKVFDFTNPHNWFHSFVVATCTVFGLYKEVYILGTLWEVWNGGNPSHKDVPLTASWLKRNFCYSDGFSREDMLMWNGLIGLGVGFLIKGILYQYGIITPTWGLF